MRHGLRLIIGLLLGASLPASAAKVFSNDDGATLNVGLLLQPQAQLTVDGAPDGTSPSEDLFLRRMRFIVSGNVTRQLSFFAETDTANFGKKGDFAAPFYIQDAFFSYAITDSFRVDAGLLLLPLSRNSLQSAATLLTIDYHSALIQYPANSQKVWRDVGAQVRGTFLGQRLVYRVGVFDGVRGQVGQKDAKGNVLPALNPAGVPRFAGHVRLNILGKEDPAFFYNGINFSSAPLLSVGFGSIFQPKAGRDEATAAPADYLAVAGDVFLEYPFGQDMELILQSDVYNYSAGKGAPGSGVGVVTEAGYRFKQIAPVASFEWFSGDAHTKDIRMVRVGLNYYPLKNNFNLKAELSRGRVDSLAAGGPVATAVTLQAQLMF